MTKRKTATPVPTAPPATPSPAPVPKAAVAGWTIPWVGLLLALMINAVFIKYQIPYETYVAGRSIAIGVMLVLAAAGLLMALNLVGSHTKDPWYQVPLLVALVLFWGLFPPCWFFVEYLSFDAGTFQLPPGIREAIENAREAKDVKAMNDMKSAFMSTTKTYADLAAKVWAAVGLALGSAIGMARK